VRRRAFLRLVGGAAVCSAAAHAQQPAMPVVGMLNSGGAHPRPDQLDGFLPGLKEMGYAPGHNINTPLSRC
jgi:putative ABC transport system substrate-binding protein